MRNFFFFPALFPRFLPIFTFGTICLAGICGLGRSRAGSFGIPQKIRTMKTFRIFLALLAVAAMSACTERPVKPRFAAVRLDTLLVEPSYECQVSYNFASIENAPKSEALQSIEQSNIGYFFELEDSEGSAAAAIAESLRQTDRQLALPESARHGGTKAQYEISVESEGSVVDTLLCYMIYRSDYLGGAHGMYSTEYHTYSLLDGYEFTAADLLGADKMEPLAALIRAKVCEMSGAASDDELSANGFFPEYISVTDNFRITPEGMIFHYNPYEIACYANGEIDIEVTREELEAL